MKNAICLLSLVSVFLIASCNTRETVVEETWPDGSARRVCIYSGKGESRQLIREISYFSNKQVRMDGAYKDGLRDGRWIAYYENGNKHSEGNYVKGKAQGLRTTYFENGKPRYVGSYQDDIRVGVWKFYDETGILLQEVDLSGQTTEQTGF